MSFLLEEPVQRGVVREPILASWTRSSAWGVPADHLECPSTDLDSESLLARAAKPVLADVADQFATEPVSVILCDADGIVLDRRTGDTTARSASGPRAGWPPASATPSGTSARTASARALEGGGPAQVFGHEHYVEHLEDLACAGVPVRHPVTGKVLGVVDLTCWRRDAGRHDGRRDRR